MGVKRNNFPAGLNNLRPPNKFQSLKEQVKLVVEASWRIAGERRRLSRAALSGRAAGELVREPARRRSPLFSAFTLLRLQLDDGAACEEIKQQLFSA
jgi:hypothetical protein